MTLGPIIWKVSLKTTIDSSKQAKELTSSVPNALTCQIWRMITVAVKTGETMAEIMGTAEEAEAVIRVEEVDIMEEAIVAAGEAAEVDTKEVAVVEVATMTTEIVVTETEEIMEEEMTTEIRKMTEAGADNSQKEKATPKDSLPEEEEVEATSDPKQHHILDKMLR